MRIICLPSELRDSAQAALPRAPTPAQQTVSSSASLVTTLARFVEPPHEAAHRFLGSEARTSPALLLSRAAEAMTSELCGLQVHIDEAWFVEELDILALALEGSWTQHAATFKPDCEIKQVL